MSNSNHQAVQFDMAGFRDDLKRLFLQVNSSIAQSDLKPVRQYLSNGLYQSLKGDLEVKKLLKIEAAFHSPKKFESNLNSSEVNGDYQAIHIRIKNDGYIHYTSPNTKYELGTREYQLDRPKSAEYWSFMRKVSSKKESAFDTGQCPRCSASLDKGVTDYGTCAYCHTILNSGEYDWILTEITPADLGESKTFKDTVSAEFKAEYAKYYDDFSIQNIEDYANQVTNLLVHSRAKNDPKLIHRFVHPEYYPRISGIVKNDPNYYYNWSYNEVQLHKMDENETAFEAHVRVKLIYNLAPKNDYQDFSFKVRDAENLDMVFVFHKLKKQAQTKVYKCKTCDANILDVNHYECTYCGAQIDPDPQTWLLKEVVNPPAARVASRHVEQSDPVNSLAILIQIGVGVVSFLGMIILWNLGAHRGWLIFSMIIVVIYTVFATFLASMFSKGG